VNDPVGSMFTYPGLEGGGGVGVGSEYGDVAQPGERNDTGKTSTEGSMMFGVEWSAGECYPKWLSQGRTQKVCARSRCR